MIEPCRLYAELRTLTTREKSSPAIGSTRNAVAASESMVASTCGLRISRTGIGVEQLRLAWRGHCYTPWSSFIVGGSFELFSAWWDPNQLRNLLAFNPDEPCITGSGRGLAVQPALHHRYSLNKLREACWRRRLEQPLIATDAFNEDCSCKDGNASARDLPGPFHELFGGIERGVCYNPVNRVHGIGRSQEVCDLPITIIEDVRRSRGCEVFTQHLIHVTGAAGWLQAGLISQAVNTGGEHMLNQSASSPRRCRKIVPAILGFDPLGHHRVGPILRHLCLVQLTGPRSSTV